MASKAAKAQKPSKAAKKAAKVGLKEATYSSPFKDMALGVFFIMAFFMWRLYEAVQSQNQAHVEAWTVFTFGGVAVINVWTFLLVMVMAKRGGDLGVLELHDNDIFRFTALSGLAGAWIAIILFGYRSKTPLFYTRLMGRTVLNLVWPMLYIKYYMKV